MFYKKLIAERSDSGLVSLISPVYTTRYVPNEQGEFYLVSKYPITSGNEAGIYAVNEDFVVNLEGYKGEIFTVEPVKSSVVALHEKGIRAEFVKVMTSEKPVITMDSKPAVRGYRDVIFRLRGDYLRSDGKILGVQLGRFYYVPENGANNLTGFLRDYDLNRPCGEKEFLVYMPYCGIETKGSMKRLFGRFVLLDRIDFFVPSFESLDKKIEDLYLAAIKEEFVGEYLKDYFDVKVIRRNGRNLAVVLNNVAYVANDVNVKFITFRKEKVARDFDITVEITGDYVFERERGRWGIFGDIHLKVDLDIVPISEWDDDDIAFYLEKTDLNIFLFDGNGFMAFPQLPPEKYHRVLVTTSICCNIPDWRKRTEFPIIGGKAYLRKPARRVSEFYKNVILEG